VKLKKSELLHQGANAIIFKNAHELKEQLTPTEKILWNCLRSKRLNGLKFRRQHPVLHYIADFYCHEANLIIEIDGGIHNEPHKKESDEARTNTLKECGITVLRFTNDDIVYDLNAVLNKITSESNYKILTNNIINR